MKRFRLPWAVRLLGRGYRRRHRLTDWKTELKATLRLALPLVALQLGQVAIETTDVVMMGWLGQDSLAAGALAVHVFMFFWLFTLGVLSAVAPMISQAIGALDEVGARRTVRQGLWAAVLVSLPSMSVLWYSEDLLLLIGQTPQVAAEAQTYLRAALWAFPASMGFVVLRYFIAALSRPRAAMVAMLSCVLLNIGLNALLMFGMLGFPRLELLGAGISTAVVHTAMFLGLLVYVLKDSQFRRYDLLVRFWKPDWQRFRQLLALGLPIGMVLMSEAGLFAVSSLMMGWLGTTALAAHAVAMQCATVTFMMPLGVSQAATVRIGLAAGAGSAEGVRQAGWIALALGLAFMSLSALMFVTIPEVLIGAFLNPDNPDNAEAFALGISFLAVAAFFQLADAGQVVGGGMLRGLSDTRIPMIYAGLGYWGVGIGTAWVLAFPLDYGGEGIWMGLAVGLTTVAIMAIWRFSRRSELGLLEKAVYRG
ncbi:MATE family efflux transporter [Fodinicurvata fenggangensis]|uniref:MATE family efflux transporter n=1 Tax=Fodinicurvata fenggangensis TaxID=1121830 RepID=UPI00068A4FB7|nr:MATE family efflux transporter [Fodinicurvata fenggangensis]